VTDVCAYSVLLDGCGLAASSTVFKTWHPQNTWDPEDHDSYCWVCLMAWLAPSSWNDSRRHPSLAMDIYIIHIYKYFIIYMLYIYTNNCGYFFSEAAQDDLCSYSASLPIHGNMAIKWCPKTKANYGISSCLPPGLPTCMVWSDDNGCSMGCSQWLAQPGM
jgi:hypothetical protein